MCNLHKAHVNLQCLTEVFLKREMFQTKVAEKSKTHTLYTQQTVFENHAV